MDYNLLAFHRSPYFVFFLIPLIIVCGCSDSAPKLYEVRGLVRYTDGQLLRRGTVEFEIFGREKAITARSEIGPDGSFALGTYAMSDGALPGKHRVVVIADHDIGAGHERPWLIAPVQLHPKYRDYRTSGLEFEVKPEINQFIIEVEYAPKFGQNAGRESSAKQ